MSIPLPILQDFIAWQKDVWNRISWRYLQEIDPRFEPITKEVLRRAALRPGESVLDLGCGTGAITIEAARETMPGGHVTAVDISAQMLLITRMRLGAFGNVTFEAGRAAEVPAPDASQDAVVSSLVLMFTITKEGAAKEIARVLKPGGRLIASVWDAPERCDIARFQEIAARYAPKPPVEGVGPTALADPKPFLAMLAHYGVDASYETATVEWEHPNLEHAWDTFAGVTALDMSPESIAAARTTLLEQMWGGKDGPRVFRCGVHYIVGRKK